MSPLLPGFQTQLEARAEQLAADHAARARRPRTRRGLHGRALGIAILAGGLALTGGAYASQWLWSPQLGDPRSDTRATASTTPVPPAQLAALGVLRRPQNAEDRGAGTRAALKFQGGNMQGLRTDAVRRLGTTAAGGAVVLLPVATAKAFAPGAGKDQKDALCLWVTDPIDGGGQGCSSLSDLRAGRMTMSLVGPPLEVQRRQLAEMKRQEAKMEADRKRRGETRKQQIDRLNREARKRNPSGEPLRLASQKNSEMVGDIIQVVPDGVATVRYRDRGRTILRPVRGNVVVVHIEPWHGTGFAWLDAAGHELQKGSRFPARKE